MIFKIIPSLINWSKFMIFISLGLIHETGGTRENAEENSLQTCQKAKCIPKYLNSN